MLGQEVHIDDLRLRSLDLTLPLHDLLHHLLLLTRIREGGVEGFHRLHYLIPASRSASRALGDVLDITVQPGVLPHPVVDQTRDVLLEPLIRPFPLELDQTGFEVGEEEFVDGVLLSLGDVLQDRPPREFDHVGDDREDRVSLVVHDIPFDSVGCDTTE